MLPGQAVSLQTSWEAPQCCRFPNDPRAADPHSRKASSPEPRSRALWPGTTVGTHPALTVYCWEWLFSHWLYHFYCQWQWLHRNWVSLKFSYRGSEQERVRVFQRGGCASALHAPLGQPIEQQQQETPRAHGTCTHQDDLPQAGLVSPHLLHR